ncbi:hypothetical protein L2E82_25764 [Cichorium intybus]|uniref:Uncharacterized protein n=1 Tax=Cichorium intybus TaxID=13427 RepID=A0ACB9E504_CICIN|nr:hypothetical protein L2E82_25764 [Cichorium intybus]
MRRIDYFMELRAFDGGGAIRFMGTKIHHNKWYKPTETYEVKGFFAMTELHHGTGRYLSSIRPSNSAIPGRAIEHNNTR